MDISSAIRVVEHSSTRLVILDPPFYLLGGITLFLSLGAALQFGRAIAAQKGSGSLALLLVSPFLLVALGLLTSSTRVTFSRETGTVSIKKRTCAFPWPAKEVPLKDIRDAEIQNGFRRTKRLALVLRSGSVVPLTSFTNFGGQYEAASTVNAFLRGS